MATNSNQINIFSVGGNYYLVRALKDLLVNNGYEFENENFDREWRKYRVNKCVLLINAITKSCALSGAVSSEYMYMSLHSEWDKAVECALSNPEKDAEVYKDDDWVWIDSSNIVAPKVDALVAYKESHGCTYGFNFNGNWTNKFNLKNENAVSLTIILRKATEAEVENALWEEWKNRCQKVGIEDYLNANIESHATGGRPKSSLNENTYIPTYNVNENKLYNKYGIVFENGIWATPIQEEKQLTFGGEPVTLKTIVPVPQTESDILVTCKGEVGTLEEIKNIVQMEPRLNVEFSGNRVNHIDDIYIPSTITKDSKISIGCLEGVFKEVVDIYYEGKKILREKLLNVEEIDGEILSHQ
jgi:hypothetical protein